MEASRPVEVDRAQWMENQPCAHLFDGATGTVRQGYVDPPKVERTGQAFGTVSGLPGLDAIHERPAAEDDGVWRPVLRDRIDAGGLKGRGERRHILAGDHTPLSGEARREISGRCGEGHGIVADRAEPVAEPGVDRRNHQPVRRLRLGVQDRSGWDAGQGNSEPDRQAARRGQSHPHAGEAAGPGRDRDQVDLGSHHAGTFHHLGNRGQQTRRLITPLLEEAREGNAVAHDGDALPAHGAIEGQDGAHGRRPRGRLAPVGAAGHCGVMKLDIVAIAPPEFDVDVTLAYATDANLTGRPVYRNAECWLHREAADRLSAAIGLARPLGYRLRIFDALRPVEAQWALWNVNPDPEFIADPRRGSPHSRGAAVDLSLLDADGNELDMGTAFDAFTPLSHHGRTDISVEAQRNRLLLMGLMTSAGWDFYRNEWWHYQLFDARRYPLVADADLPRPMM